MAKDEVSKPKNKQIRIFAIFLIFLGILLIGLVLISEDGKASPEGWNDDFCNALLESWKGGV